MYACRECPHEQKTFSARLSKCGNRKLEHVGFLEQNLDEHWRELLKAEKGSIQ
jgi:hypothetical protein